MTQTTTSTEPPPEAATGSNVRLHPSDILMNLIVALLAPMFLGVSAGDIGLARMAAAETVNAYRARNLADLLAVAQIIAFGLAALGSLSLSMEDDISLSMVLRLRGNANALNRSAEQNRRALRESSGDDPMPHRAAMAAEPEAWEGHAEDGSLDEAEVFLNVAAAQVLASEARARLQRGAEQTAERTRAAHPAQIAAPATAPMTTEKRHQEMWAIAMVKEAGEITASIPNLPPAERRTALIRASALSGAANELLTDGGSPPPIPSGHGAPVRSNAV